ncbi:MAG: polysaccharide pyruvyl transferase family protein [Bacteroidaceae bacterium]
MKQRIGLVSYPFSYNYGTCLQAFALAYFLKGKGYDVEYIDYSARKSYRSIAMLKYIAKHPILFLSEIFHKNAKDNLDYSFVGSSWYKSTITKSRKFYENNVPISNIKYDYDSIRSVNLPYDKFIVGSDQTWSKHVNPLLSCFFLNFVPKGKKKIAYAPSMGGCIPTGLYKKIISYYLKSFDSLSCRDKNCAEYLSGMLKTNVECVLDPTLLINGDEWKHLSDKSKKIDGEYILVYILGERQAIVDYAEELGKKKNLPIYYIVTRDKYLKMQNHLLEVDPLDFVSLISNAKFVITDSYHAMLFSVNIGINFFIFNKRDNGGDNGRLLDFLEKFNLLDNYINSSLYQEIQPIDFYKVESSLMNERQKSIDYLLTSLR